MKPKKPYEYCRFRDVNQKTTKDYILEGEKNAQLLELRAMENEKKNQNNTTTLRNATKKNQG